MFRFDEQILKSELSRLPAQSRVAFAASSAQRLISAYRAFAKISGQPAAQLEDPLEYVWTHLLTQPQRGEVKCVLAEVMALIPAEDGPGWTPLVAYAEDAVSAVAYCLRCLLSGEAQDAAWAARRVYEALDQFVIARDDITPGAAGTEHRILQDPLIQAELQRQKRDLTDLQSVDNPSSDLLEMLRVRSSAEQAIVVPE
jgi:uncharacterized protein YjaG (DUF416 family)